MVEGSACKFPIVNAGSFKFDLGNNEIQRDSRSVTALNNKKKAQTCRVATVVIQCWPSMEKLAVLQNENFGGIFGFSFGSLSLEWTRMIKAVSLIQPQQKT